jgi:UDP-GlcNAc:undecaprenyl-phosphate GlcNAc-1-phosphate transferase
MKKLALLIKYNFDIIQKNSINNKGFLMLPFFLSFILSAVFVYMIYKKGYGLDKAAGEKAHALHTYQVSRLGGLGVIASITITSIFFSPLLTNILIAGTAIFTFGFLEDRFNLDLPYSKKIAFIFLSTLILIYMTKEGVFNGGFIVLNKNNPIEAFIGYLIAIIGIVGFASAVNFIDGLNGYAMGVIFITLSFFGYHFYITGMYEYLKVVLILNGAILGFLIFNFPFGKIFLGDMGAHLIGFIVGFLSIAMTNHDPKLTVWYPLATFTLPVIETLNTIYRRIKRKKEGIPFNQSDLDHLHHYVLRYIKDKYSNIKDNTIKNSIAAIYILIPHLILNIIAFYFRYNPFALILIFIIASLSYLWVYNKLKLKI